MKVTPTRYGYVLRDLAHQGTRHDFAFGFPRDEAHRALGVHTSATEANLMLLKEAGYLATHNETGSEGHRFTRAVKLPSGENKRLVVVLGVRERARVEQLARGLRYDAAQAKRAEREATWL